MCSIEDMEKEDVPKDYFAQHLYVLRFLGFSILPVKNTYLRYVYNVFAFLQISITLIIFLIFEFQAFIDNKEDMDKVTFILGYWLCHFMGKNGYFTNFR